MNTTEPVQQCMYIEISNITIPIGCIVPKYYKNKQVIECRE